VENRNDLLRQGCTPCSRQTLATAWLEILRCRASNRDDQCLTPYFFGGGAKVAAITRSPVDHPRAAGAILIHQTLDALGLIPLPPTDHRRTRDTDPFGDGGVPESIRRQQHDPSPLRHPRRARGRTRQPLQLSTVTLTQHQRWSRTIRDDAIVATLEASNN
jgi:hypothetical protein